MNLVDENGDVTRELFHFLKYNQIPRDESSLSDKDEALYKEFVRKVNTLKQHLKDDSNSASGILGSIMSMFGFNRHYCSISGLPIIGKYFKIGGKIVSQEAYEAYKTVQELESIEKPPKNTKLKTGNRE